MDGHNVGMCALEVILRFRSLGIETFPFSKIDELQHNNQPGTGQSFNIKFCWEQLESRDNMPPKQAFHAHLS